MPKQVDILAQRQTIASAAVTVIGSAGLDGARLRDVARMANVTTGAVTHYFDSKDAVLEAALDEVVRRLLDKQAQTGALDGNVIDRVCAFLPLNAETREEWRVWLAFWGRAIVNERLRAIHRDYYATIVRRLAAALDAEGRLGGGRAEALADAIVAAVDGVGTRATLEPETWPPERQRETLRLLLAPLFAGVGDSQGG